MKTLLSFLLIFLVSFVPPANYTVEEGEIYVMHNGFHDVLNMKAGSKLYITGTYGQINNLNLQGRGHKIIIFSGVDFTSPTSNFHLSGEDTLINEGTMNIRDLHMQAGGNHLYNGGTILVQENFHLNDNTSTIVNADSINVFGTTSFNNTAYHAFQMVGCAKFGTNVLNVNTANTIYGEGVVFYFGGHLNLNQQFTDTPSLFVNLPTLGGRWGAASSGKICKDPPLPVVFKDVSFKRLGDGKIYYQVDFVDVTGGDYFVIEESVDGKEWMRVEVPAVKMNALSKSYKGNL